MPRRVLQRASMIALSVFSLLAAPPASLPCTDASSFAAANYPEVRLRKLHLVRPDLIPYPIAYEVIC